MGETHDLAHNDGKEKKEDGEENKTPSFKIFVDRFDISLFWLGLSFAVVIVIDFLVAFFTGIYLNYEVCGDFWSCTMTHRHDHIHAGTSLNYLVGLSKSCAVAIAASLLRLFVKYRTHGRIWGVFSFVAFCTLSIIVAAKCYANNDSSYTSATSASASQISLQIKNLLQGDPVEHTDWAGITKASFFYNWMKEPFKDFISANRLNKDRKQPGILLPSLIDHTGQSKAAVWKLYECRIRQQRVNWVLKGDPYRYHGIQKVYKDFDLANQNLTARRSIGENFHESAYKNKYGKRITAKDFRGDMLIGAIYSGNSGLSVGGRPVNRTSDGIRYLAESGIWWAATTTPDDIERDVKHMEDSWWIDEATRMVQVSCTGINPGANQRFTLSYTLEFAASGLVLPMVPRISTHIFTSKDTDMSDPVLEIMVLFFYFLNEEVQDLLLLGVKPYVAQQGYLNLIDWAAIIAAWFMYSSGVLITKYNAGHAHVAGTAIVSEAEATSEFQIAIGIFLFMECIKLLKFSRNIPIANTLGKTIHEAMKELVFFIIVMMVLLLAFAFAFNCIFCTEMTDFGNLGHSIFSIYRGLLGDMDVDTIYMSHQRLGPLLYVFYIFVVLFVAFTILIAIIIDAYNTVKEGPEENGMYHELKAYYLSGTTSQDAPPPDSAASLVSELQTTIRELKEQREKERKEHEAQLQGIEDKVAALASLLPNSSSPTSPVGNDHMDSMDLAIKTLLDEDQGPDAHHNTDSNEVDPKRSIEQFQVEGNGTVYKPSGDQQNTIRV